MARILSVFISKMLYVGSKYSNNIKSNFEKKITGLKAQETKQKDTCIDIRLSHVL